MTAKDFFFLTKEVREAQKAYFKTRTKEALDKSKQLESQLDAEIERTLIAKGLKEKPHTQTNLEFNVPAGGWTPSKQVR